jgi:Subtilase family/PA domain/Peptidase inhibitor I9
MLHLKKWGGMLGLFALVAVAGAASYQFLYSGTKRPEVVREARKQNVDLAQVNNIARTSFSKSYVYDDGFNDGNGISPPGRSTKIGYLDNYSTFIVLFKEAPLAAYKGGNNLLAVPTKRAGLNGKQRLDVKSYESRNYLGYLQSQQRNMEAKMSNVIGHEFSVSKRMQHAVNGVIVHVSREEAERFRKMPEVLLVEENRDVPMDTDTGPALIGAPAVWTGTNPGAPAAYRGEGMVVGIIDSGINFGSPSFAATGPVDSYAHINPLGTGNFLGTCAAGGVDAGRCNDKLIGGYDFVCGLPANQCGATNTREEPGFGDTNGHGSHTASTAAGNLRDAIYTGAPVRISGVAQRANVIAYDVCYTEISTGRGLCPSSSSVAAVDQAVADGIVDAINFSIGGGVDPWTDAVSLAFLNAVDAGIYIAASAGNSGPAANTLGHNEPWVGSTAAAQHGRAGFSIAMQVTGPAPVPANLAPLLVNQGTGGVAFSATIPGTTPLFISPGINTTSDGCAAYPANAFAGGIAVIRRGTCSFAIKTNNASAAGAIAVIIANNAAGVILPSVPGTTIPVFSVTQTEGDALRDFGQANPTTTTAQIGFPALPIPNIPDVLAAFSSRGPAGTYSLLKPDVTAPGASILAAYAGTTSVTGFEQLVEIISGTSMASPHQAGSALLIRQARPSWTVPEVKSALALTADQTVYLEDSITLANPFARGSGRIRVDRAINAGLVMNETRANYLAANPATTGNPATLNQANLIERSCFSSCSFFRTFRNTTATATSWRVQLQGVSGSVTPIITVPGNGSLTLKINLYGYALAPNGNFTFGNVVLTPATGSGPVLRLPVAIAVQPPAMSMPASLSASAPTNSAASASFTIANTGGSALNYTFVNSGTALGIVANADNTGVSSGFRSITYTDPATAGSAAQYSADDFVLTQTTQITSILTQGFVVSGAVFPGAATNLTWSIYPDAGGLPAGNPQSAAAAAVWTYTTTPTGTGVTAGGNPTSISLNLTAAGQNVSLPPGRYWLVANTRGTFANRWAHYGSNTATGNAGFASITVTTAGAGAWTANAAFPGLSMRVMGNLPCGAPWISGTYASSGTLARGASRSALTAINTTGVAAGNYRANVCVQSNDPLIPSLAVPLSLTVTP